MDINKITKNARKLISLFESKEGDDFQYLKITDYGECIDVVCMRGGDVYHFRVYSNGTIYEK